MSHDFPALLLAMAAAALFCRVVGFTLMRLVPVSGRVEAALRATPLAVMAGIAALAVQSGGLAEALALAAVVGITIAIGSDVAAAILGVVIVAALRWLGL